MDGGQDYGVWVVEWMKDEKYLICCIHMSWFFQAINLHLLTTKKTSFY